MSAPCAPAHVARSRHVDCVRLSSHWGAAIRALGLVDSIGHWAKVAEGPEPEWHLAREADDGPQRLVGQVPFRWKSRSSQGSGLTALARARSHDGSGSLRRRRDGHT